MENRELPWYLGGMTESKAIKVTCVGAGTVPVDRLMPFQDELKDLSQEAYLRLRESIIRLGFTEPVSIWVDGETEGGFPILNGHQRVRAAQEMTKEGFDCPPLPVSFIEAASYEEAKDKVLAMTSSYGTITKQGLYEFASDMGIPMSELAKRYQFPEVNLDDFAVEFGSFEPIPIEGEDAPTRPAGEAKAPEEPTRDGTVFDRTPEQYANSAIKQVVLFFAAAEYEALINKLDRLMAKFDLENYSELVGKLVDESIESLPNSDS